MHQVFIQWKLKLTTQLFFYTSLLISVFMTFKKSKTDSPPHLQSLQTQDSEGLRSTSTCVNRDYFPPLKLP